MTNKFLYFADSANEQYIVPAGRLLGADDTDADTIVLNFEDMNGTTGEVSQVTIDVSSGTAKTVLTSIGNAISLGKESVIVVADDVNSAYIDANITSVTGITHNVTSASSGITASSGNIVASSGNIVASSGNITASSGNIVATDGNLVITAADHGIIHTNSGTITQSTDHTTGVTINATSGVIQLAAVALAATTNAEFTVTNSTVQADSVVLVTVQDENTTDNVQLSAAVHTIAGGSFKISLVNPHSSGDTSATASKIHFLVINNS